MDVNTRIRITNLLNEAFNILECDEHGYKYKELKTMIWDARNLSTWLLVNTTTVVDGKRVKHTSTRTRSDFKQIYDNSFKPRVFYLCSSGQCDNAYIDKERNLVLCSAEDKLCDQCEEVIL